MRFLVGSHLDHYPLMLWGVHLYWSGRIKIVPLFPKGGTWFIWLLAWKHEVVFFFSPGILCLYFQLLNWHWFFFFFFFCFLTNRNNNSLITRLQIKMNQQGLGNRYIYINELLTKSLYLNVGNLHKLCDKLILFASARSVLHCLLVTIKVSV